MDDEKSMCPLRYLTDILGGKWKIPVICILSSQNEPMRYSVIRRRLEGITNMMLAQSLRELETCGMITRTQYNEVPPRVEYALTQKGRSVLPVLSQAVSWALSGMNSEGIHAKCKSCTQLS